MSLPRGIRYVSGPPGDGYGYAAQGYLGLFEQLGVPVQWEPYDFTTGRPLELPPDQSRFATWIGRAVDHDTVIVNLPPDRVPALVAGDEHRLKVTITTDETDRIPASWVRDLTSVDRVLVPTTFNRDVFLASGVATPMWVVPHLSSLPMGATPLEHPALDSPFVFYAIGPWTTRKGLGETVRAFADAFTAADPVALVIKTGLVDHQAKMQAIHAARQAAAERREANRRIGHRLARRLGRGRGPTDDATDQVRLETWWTLAQLLATRPSPPSVLLITDIWDEATVARLHRRGDCYISLNRGEGFGFTVLDAGRHANPVVITGWGGPLDIVGPGYPLLVDHRMIAMADDVADDWMRTNADERWAATDHDDAVDKLRWVFDHQDEARAIGHGLAQRAEANFGTQAVTEALTAALDH